MTVGPLEVLGEARVVADVYRSHGVDLNDGEFVRGRDLRSGLAQCLAIFEPGEVHGKSSLRYCTEHLHGCSFREVGWKAERRYDRPICNTNIFESVRCFLILLIICFTVLDVLECAVLISNARKST